MASRRPEVKLIDRVAPWVFILGWLTVVVADCMSFLLTGTLEQKLFNLTLGQAVTTALYLAVRGR